MNATAAGMATHLLPSGFWDAMAPHHSSIENHYFNLSTIRRIMSDFQEPVLVVGAGQGLHVAEIRKKGLQCDGIDLSCEMIRYAKLRRGISLIRADAKAMPMAAQTYGTVIYSTGVIDLTEDEQGIKVMLKEGRRVVRDSGKIFVAFYRLGAGSESFMKRIGLLKKNTLAFRQSLDLFRLNPLQMIAWVAGKAGLSYPRAAILLLGMTFSTTIQEKVTTLKMRGIFRRMRDLERLINVAPERHPYRNEAELRNLFERLAIPVRRIDAFATSYIARI